MGLWYMLEHCVLLIFRILLYGPVALFVARFIIDKVLCGRSNLFILISASLVGALLLHLDLPPQLLLHSFILLDHPLILPEPFSQYMAHVFEHVVGELDGAAFVVDVAVEAGLEGEAVHDAELAPEDDAGRLQLGLLDAELARVEAEHRRTLAQQLRQHPHLQVTLVVQGEVRTVYEDRLLPRVTVDVDERTQRLRLLRVSNNLTNKSLDSAHSGMKFDIRCMKLSVEVVSTHRRAVVSNYNTIRVSHRNHLEDYSLPQLHGTRFFRTDIVEEALHYIRRICLARMHPAAHYYVLLVLIERRW